MASRDDVIINIIADVKQAISGIATFAAKMGAAMIAIRAVTGAIKAGINIAADLVKAYGEDEKAATQLAAAIRATGRESEISVYAIRELASSLQQVTTYGDEATVSAVAMVQQLSNLNEDGLKKVTPAMLDFAAAMGVDLNTAATLIGKTLGSTTNALSRYGIEVDMTGTESEKLAELVGVLTEKFGGMAEAMGTTSLGEAEKFKNAFGDLKEAMGEVVNTGVGPMRKWLTGLMQELASNIGKANELRDAIRNIPMDPTMGPQDRLAEAIRRRDALRAEMNKMEAEVAKQLESPSFSTLLRGTAVTAAQKEQYQQMKDNVAILENTVIPGLTRQVAALNAVGDSTKGVSEADKEVTAIWEQLAADMIRIDRQLRDSGGTWDDHEARVDAVTKAYNALASTATNNIENRRNIIELYGKYLPWLTQEEDILRVLAVEVEAIGKLHTELGNSYDYEAKMSDAVIAAYESLIRLSGDHSEAVTEFREAYGEWLPSAMDKTLNTVKNGFPSWDALLVYLGKVEAATKKVIEGLKPTKDFTVPALDAYAEMMWQINQTDWGNITDSFKGALIDAGLLTDSATAIATVSNTWEAYKNNLEKARLEAEAMSAVLGTMDSSYAVDDLQSLTDALGELIDATGIVAKVDIGPLEDAIRSFAANAGLDIEKVTDAVTQFAEAIVSLKSSLRDLSFRAVTDAAYEWGKALGLGKDNAYSAEAAVAAFFKTIIDNLPNIFLSVAASAAASGDVTLALAMLAAAGISAAGSGYISGLESREGTRAETYQEVPRWSPAQPEMSEEYRAMWDGESQPRVSTQSVNINVYGDINDADRFEQRVVSVVRRMGSPA